MKYALEAKDGITGQWLTLSLVGQAYIAEAMMREWKKTHPRLVMRVMENPSREVIAEAS